MKAVFYSFRRFLAGVLDDYMLIACILAPIFMGLAFKIGIPLLESYLCDTFEKAEIIALYYLIFDLLIAAMTPVMFTFSGVMTTLEELDNGTARYLMVTPIGKLGYIMSRIGITTLISLPYAVIAVAVFGISGMNLLMNATVSLLCAISGVIIAFLVIAFAHNKVEGMALIKLSGILILGIPAAFFLPQPIAYISGLLPSYWLTEMAQSGNYLFALPTLFTSAIWLLLLYRKFSSKLV